MKTTRIVTAAAIAAALTIASPARADTATVTVEAFGGWQNLQLNTGSLVGATNGTEGTGIIGADVMAGFGLLGVGAVVDKTVNGAFQPWAGALMLGVLVPLTVVRIELMGELGRRAGDFGDLFSSTGQTFVGLRPGVSFRLVPSPIIIGVSGIVRWPTSGSEIGSPDYGIVGRIGFGFF
jgi:hypothetical protein